jgi:hypothetical protein
VKGGKTKMLKVLRSFNLQLFANIDEILTANAKAFEGTDVKGQFSAINTKLNELGYDVLINHKEKAEFIPSSRLSEVVGQRDQFKGKVEELNIQLGTLLKEAGDNKELAGKYQDLIAKNNTLLKDLEQTRVNSEIMLAAKDAVNAKDLLLFINYDNIKVNSKGEVMGVEGEITRIKQEKPYLFQTAGDGKKNKGGVDNNGGGDSTKLGGMNAAIRRAAGRF